MQSQSSEITAEDVRRLLRHSAVHTEACAMHAGAGRVGWWLQAALQQLVPLLWPTGDAAVGRTWFRR